MGLVLEGLIITLLIPLNIFFKQFRMCPVFLIGKSTLGTYLCYFKTFLTYFLITSLAYSHDYSIEYRVVCKRAEGCPE